MDKRKKEISMVSTKATISIFSYENRCMIGRAYNDYFEKTVYFCDLCGMIYALEGLFDSLSLPQASTRYREFRKNDNKVQQGVSQPKRRITNMQQEEKATFVVHVQFRRNATWQGNIQWVDQNKTQSFRSTLELVRLIDDALEGTQRISWDKEAEEIG